MDIKHILMDILLAAGRITESFLLNTNLIHLPEAKGISGSKESTYLCLCPWLNKSAWY